MNPDSLALRTDVACFLKVKYGAIRAVTQLCFCSLHLPWHGGILAASTYSVVNKLSMDASYKHVTSERRKIACCFGAGGILFTVDSRRRFSLESKSHLRMIARLQSHLGNQPTPHAVADIAVKILIHRFPAPGRCF